MNKNTRFAFLAQTYLIMVREVNALLVLDEAMCIPEDVIPNDVAAAAKAWLEWKTVGGEKPAWLIEHEENTRNVIIVEKLDGTDEWWRNAEKVIDGATVPKVWISFVTGRSISESMNKREAEGFVEWAKEVPGWSDEEPPMRLHTS